MKVALGVIAIILILALIVGGMYAGRRNEMVRLNEQVKSNWAQVDVVLQRRADLIPNLVETVKGYAKQEQTVFGDIAKARSALLSAHSPQEKIAANGQLDGALGRLLVIVEVTTEREKWPVIVAVWRVDQPVVKLKAGTRPRRLRSGRAEP